MFHPKKNRIFYGEQLVPPDGYELTSAIGTTYSLDLQALMLLPVAMFYARIIDCKPDEPGYDMLDAITKAAGKISVYYQSSQLKVPQKYHYLMAYWEKCIQPVTMPEYTSSFHPKLWVTRYEQKGSPARYRLLITSRNLTMVRDWDMAYSAEGEVKDKEQPRNRPLVQFLRYLDTTGQKKIAPSFIEDLMKVKFDFPEEFESFRFVPVGIPDTSSGKRYTNPLTSAGLIWDELLIVSPFADSSTLKDLKGAVASTPYLLSRKEELDSIDEIILKEFNCWQFSGFFQDAESYEKMEDGDDAPMPQQLHAKLFVCRKENNISWYLGSANCSAPAQGRNVEFMIEIRGSNIPGLRVKDVYNALTNTDKTDGVVLFTPYDSGQRVSAEDQKRIEQLLRKVRYDLTKMEIEGEAIKIPGGTAFDLVIKIDASEFKLPGGFQVKIRPLPDQQSTGVLLNPGTVNVIKEFGGYAETSLSIYLIVEIIHDKIPCSSFLLPMDIELPESRLNKIFSSIINSREKFLKYLNFILSGQETGLIDGTPGEGYTVSKKGNSSVFFEGTPVYEKLLIAASRNPEKINAIDLLISRLKKEQEDEKESVVSPDFEEFWQVFKNYTQSKK